MTIPYTAAAARTLAAEQFASQTVLDWSGLLALGFTRSQVRARVAARRWQRFGRAFVLHRGEPNRDERRWVALLNSHRAAFLTSFTSLEKLGLVRWERDEVHVMGPLAANPLAVEGVPIVLHRTRTFDPSSAWSAIRCQRAAPALLVAAAELSSPRSVCGLTAAVVQQRLATGTGLRETVEAAHPGRNHRILLNAARDIEMGAQALSEIDLGRLCHRYRLPQPRRQAVRIERSGRRRYLDAEFVRSDGSRFAVEVDGALHLLADRWFSDQFRQNEIVIGGTPVLRFPSFSLRNEQDLVADQLRRMLG